MQSSKTDGVFSRAEGLREKSSYGKALVLYKKALAGYRKRDDAEGVLNCLMAIGDVCRMTGDFVSAEDSYAGAMIQARSLGDPMAAADAQLNRGLAFRGMGDWKNAIALSRRALRFYEKRDDRHAVAFSLWALAGALRIKGDIPAAITTYRKSGDLFKALKIRPAAGYCLCGLGGTHRIAGLFRDSLKYYNAANRLFQGIGDRFGTAYSYCGIGNALRMQGRYREALASFARASAIYKRIGDRVSYAYTVWSIGTTYKMLGRHADALRHFRLAQGFFTKTRDPRGIIYCWLGFGEIALLEGRKAAASKYIERSVEEAVRYGFRVEACHARVLRACLSGRLNTGCYARIGLKLNFTSLPLNIP